jgi:DUF3068 family protein
MRRVAGVLLIALGVFAVTLGFMLPTVVYNRLAVAPLDPDAETVAQGTNVTVLYPSLIAQGAANPVRTDVTVTARRVVSGKLDAPEVKLNGDVALWRVGLVVEDEKSTLINAVEQWVCVDRRTAEGQQKCTEQKIDDGTSVVTDVNQAGLAYKFPFNTERKTYTFFDVTLHKATPIVYDGDETINGLKTYRFLQRIEPTKVDTRDVPAALLGGTTGAVTADRMYQNARRVWVEPATGQIVKGSEEVRQWLVNPANGRGLPVLQGTLTWTPQTIQRQVDDAKKNADKLNMLTNTAPLVLWIVGGVMLVLGIFLTVMGSRSGGSVHRHRGSRTQKPEPAAARSA